MTARIFRLRNVAGRPPPGKVIHVPDLLWESIDRLIESRQQRTGENADAARAAIELLVLERGVDVLRGEMGLP